jgi:hypothetical protein
MKNKSDALSGSGTSNELSSDNVAAEAHFDFESEIAQLLRHDGGELSAFVTVVESDVKVPNTLARVHCNVIQLDGNGMPRIKDLARWLAYHVMDYAIPRQQIVDAQTYDKQHNTTRRMAELKGKAVRLFTRLTRTGEGGEILLYVLAQTQLRLPQLFCKMPHKTSTALHLHGIDGIHVGIDSATGRLALYWGESKLHNNVSSAVSEALDSIKPFVCHEGGSGAPYERDLQLMRDNIDLGDARLEEAMLRFLDRDDPKHNEVQFRGVCLIGFDHNCYPTAYNTKEISGIIDEVRLALQAWLQSVEKKITNRAPLESVHIELFLIPFPSVESFRQSFLGEMKHV